MEQSRKNNKKGQRRVRSDVSGQITWGLTDSSRSKKCSDHIEVLNFSYLTVMVYVFLYLPLHILQFKLIPLL